MDEGKVVWWAADGASAYYYQVSEVSVLMNPLEETLTELPFPGLVLLSKADVYDNDGTLRQWLRIQGWQAQAELTAFTIYGPAKVDQL
ncbi:MAG: hypothetical protein HC904_02655 [Blastochloris sp.]|nr:hypothetical protein [Blastochloris sp.]